MKQKLTLFFILLLSSLLLKTCRTENIEDMLRKFQKSAYIKMANDDYRATYNQLDRLSSKHNGFIKLSGDSRNLYGNEHNTIDMHIPHKDFDNFMVEMRGIFGHDIIEETISMEKSFSGSYRFNGERIKDLKEQIEELEFIKENSDDRDEKIVAEYQLSKSKRELEKLRVNNLSMLESMDYSSVVVDWEDINNLTDAVIEEETIAGLPVNNNDDGSEFNENITEPEAGLQPANDEKTDKIGRKIIIFTKYGQEEIVGLGEPVTILFSGIDKDNVDLKSTVNLKNYTIRLKALPKRSNINK